MLKSRILTAVCLAPLVVAALLLLALHWFAALFAVVLVVAASEWCLLAGIRSPAVRVAYGAGVLGACALAWMIGRPAWEVLVGAGAICWVYGTVVVLAYPRSAPLIGPRPLRVLGLVLLPAVWAALVLIRSAPQGGMWLLGLFVLVWAADIGAYFAGRALGRHKLAPALSPGKTWEGAAGGLALALAVGFGMLAVWAPDRQSIGMLAVLVALVVVSVVGDLFESALKREAGVKDSGSLLPGHGGLLDRIDSLIAAVPVYAVYLLF